jgi:hypothetical protein
MQSSTGQYSTHAGDPAQPVQHSVMTASSFGFFFRGVMMPLERGSCFNSAGTIPPAFPTSRSEFMARDYIPHPIVLEHFQLQRVRRYPVTFILSSSACLDQTCACGNRFPIFAT